MAVDGDDNIGPRLDEVQWELDRLVPLLRNVLGVQTMGADAAKDFAPTEEVLRKLPLSTLTTLGCAASCRNTSSLSAR